MAETLVEELGVQRMVEAGMLNADLDDQQRPDVQRPARRRETAVFSAAFDCAL